VHLAAPESRVVQQQRQQLWPQTEAKAPLIMRAVLYLFHFLKSSNNIATTLPAGVAIRV